MHSHSGSPMYFVSGVDRLSGDTTAAQLVPKNTPKAHFGAAFAAGATF
jgi:hypothetical protein